MQRFSFPQISLGKNILIKDESFIHQISRVLRAVIGESIILFNEDGEDYIYIIKKISKKDIELTFAKKIKNLCEREKSIRLYQSIPNKHEKIEYILQKGAEVWIQEFIFFRSERSQKLIINERKIARFQEILREATEQCGGNKVPGLLFLENSIPLPESGHSYILHTEESESKHLRDIEIVSWSVNIFIGPEGGWSDKEILFFKENNMTQLHLGRRILRTETTGIVVAFFLLIQ